MNHTNDFVSTLINNRERFVDKLQQNYSYNFLLKTFSEINTENDPTIKILPSDKILYRILTGQFAASRYDKSSIDWIPSEELVNGIISIANSFNINHIEELYTGMGILSALLKNKQNEINITAADTFNNSSTCNKLNLFAIAKRSALDYKYYPILKESYPDMVISTYFPDTFTDANEKIIDELLNLIYNHNHKIIMIILPNTYTYLNEKLYYVSMSNMYIVRTYHVKALNKYFFITDLLKKYYKSSMIAHILVKSNIHTDEKMDIDTIFSSAIIPTSIIDTQCAFKRMLQCYYDKLSPKLVKCICRKYDFARGYDISNHTKLTDLTTYIINFKMLHLPQYIYDVDEFLFWATYANNKIYYLFDKRENFYDFYTTAKSMENSEIRQKYYFPPWINNVDYIYIYIYMDIIIKNDDWKKNFLKFSLEFKRINKQNKNLLMGNLLN
jgi:hypothetical protein